MIRDTYSISADIAHGPRAFLLKTDNLFCVLNDRGNIAGPAHAGLYYKDMRYVMSYEPEVNDEAPALVDARLADDNNALHIRLSHDLLNASGQINTIFIERTIYLRKTALCERIDLRSSSSDTVNVSLKLKFDADFSDIFEIRKSASGEERKKFERTSNDRGVLFNYVGRDAVPRSVRIALDPEPESTTVSGAKQGLSIPAGETVSAYVTINCDSADIRCNASGFSAGLEELRRERQCKRENAACVSTDNADFNAWFMHSLADLDMLITNKETGPYPYAGLPWFCAPFGRDGIITALQTLWLDPSIASGVLGFLAKTQATDVSSEHDAEPGKILHEARLGELANSGEVPFKHYYGSVDATPLFVMLAGEYFQRTGDREFVRDIWSGIENALRWIDQSGDADGDGFVEYQRMTDSGLHNQGWKDSVDSVFHADGSLAEGPIALCEVQAYVYAAKRGAARIASHLGIDDTASRLADEATSLKERFNDQFWSDELQFYVLALDGHKRQCTVRSSNAGHLLLTGIASEDRAQIVADTLCRQSFFSGWGIRTIADTEARFDPLSYHNGSVWPHDTSLFAMGLARYGLTNRIDTIFQGMLDLSMCFELYRLPELVSGHQRESKGPDPVRFPHACAPQAWSAGVAAALLGAILGIAFDATRKRVTFRQSRLPPFLDSVRLRGLGIGEASADLTINRQNDTSEIVVEETQGEIELLASDKADVPLSVLP